MGRRKKAAKKVVKKKKTTVPTVFKCIFCSTEDSVTVSLNFSTMIGDLKCRSCNASFQTKIHNLTDPIDVYTEWFDQAVLKQAEENPGLFNGASDNVDDDQRSNEDDEDRDDYVDQYEDLDEEPDGLDDQDDQED